MSDWDKWEEEHNPYRTKDFAYGVTVGMFLIHVVNVVASLLS